MAGDSDVRVSGDGWCSAAKCFLAVVLIGGGAPARATDPITAGELRELAAWVEAESGHRAQRRFPEVRIVPGAALDRLAAASGRVFGHYDPEANILRLRQGGSREQTLAWAVHELAHWVWTPDDCLRDAEVFAYAMEARWAEAHGLSPRPASRAAAAARARPCLAETMAEIRVSLEGRAR